MSGIQKVFGAAALFCFFLTLQTASAIDLTGTWEGKQVCQYFDGRESIVVSDDELQVTQIGSEMYFSSVIVDAIFHAQVLERSRHSNKSAQAIFIECDTDESATYQEIGRANKLQVIAKGGGVFEGTSNFYQEDPDRRFIGTCQWTYRRVSTANPHVPACGAAATRIPKAGRSFKPNQK